MEQSFGSEKIFFPMHYFHDLSLQVHPSRFLPDSNHKLATLILEKKINEAYHYHEMEKDAI